MRNPSIRPLLIVLLVIAMFILLVAGIKGWRLYSIARSLQGHQTEAEQIAAGGVKALDADRVEKLVMGIRSDVVDLKNETSPLMFLTPYLGWVPKYGGLIVESPDLMTIADAGTRAAETVFPAFKPALSVLGSAETQENTVAALSNILVDAQPQLAAISADVDEISSAYDRIENREQMPYQARQLFPLVDQFLPLANDGLLATKLIPSIVGTDSPSTFLVLVQNEDEIRASGGFISGVGTLTIENGQISQLIFEDAYNIDDLSRLDQYGWPPNPFTEFMGLEYFLFRDSNFWVDFPTTAQKSAELYQIGRPESPQIDGVIAINQRFLELLINAIGPIEVPDLGTLTGENVLESIRGAYNTVEEGETTSEWYRDRKAFMGVIAAEIQTKIFNDPTAIDPVKLVDLILISLQERHLQLWLQTAESQQTLSELGWSGSVEFSDEQDHLFIVDNNFGYNKVNITMTRSYQYSLSLKNLQSPFAELNIRHQHNGTESEADCVQYSPLVGELQYDSYIDQCYYNYQRILVPRLTQLLSASESSAPGEWFVTGQPWNGESRLSLEPEHATIERFLVVQRGKFVDSQITYTLSPTLVKTNADGSRTYKLTVYKQGGMEPESVRINIELPDNTTLLSTIPADPTISGKRITFDLILSADTDFSVTFR